MARITILEYFPSDDRAFVNAKETDPYLAKHKIICIRGRGVGRSFEFKGVIYTITEASLSQDKYYAVLHRTKLLSNQRS